MEELGPNLLELEAKAHDELIHTTGLIMATATGAGLGADKELCSMSGAVGRCERINLTPEPTEPAVELINGVLPLLKTAKCLVQGIELRLAGATVATLQVHPHLPRSGKISNLRTDLEGDGLADDHLGRGVVCIPPVQLPLKCLESSGREGRGPISSLKGGARGVGEKRSHGRHGSAIDMAEDAEAVKDPLDGQSPRDVVGAVKHHVGVLEIPMPDLRKHATKAIGIHEEEEEGRQGAGAGR